MDEIADVTHKMSLVKITGHNKSNKFTTVKVRVLGHYGGQNTILVTGVLLKRSSSAMEKVLNKTIQQ